MTKWKSVPKKEYAQHNYVSTNGEVKRNGKILKQHIRNGYSAVCLYNPETKKKGTQAVHRLVALSFIPNPDNKKYVNHINGKKTCNNVENLEWVTAAQNANHARKSGLHKSMTRKVQQYSRKGEYIKTFSSILEASKSTGANDRHISAVCLGKRKTTGGFKWKYVNPPLIVTGKVVGKEIKDFPNYKVTQDGKVFSKRAKKYLTPKILPSGYRCVKLCNNTKMVDTYIRKLVREYYPQKPSVLSQQGKPVDGFGENSKVKV